MTVDPSESKSERRTIFQATITADSEVFASLDNLDIDYMPTREQLDGTTWKVTAILELEQLRAIVAAGAVVELQRLIDQRFPRDRIMPSEDVQRRLKRLEPHFRADK
jgi:hypothetical protein